jgi:hypothetical protein
VDSFEHGLLTLYGPGGGGAVGDLGVESFLNYPDQYWIVWGAGELPIFCLLIDWKLVGGGGGGGRGDMWPGKTHNRCVYLTLSFQLVLCRALTSGSKSEVIGMCIVRVYLSIILCIALLSFIRKKIRQKMILAYLSMTVLASEDPRVTKDLFLL